MNESENVSEILQRAFRKKIVVPAFNVAHLPMLAPIVQSLTESATFGIIEVARIEVEKLGAESYEAVAREYEVIGDRRFTRLHLDHIPVIDEDGENVDWRSLIHRGLDLGYDSVMIDGSRLPLQENMEIAKEVVSLAHSVDKPVEAELGAVLGHEQEAPLSYDEIYQKRLGFTDPDQAALFIKETNVDWLSVAIGNIHGGISGAAKDKDKVEARLNIEYLKKLNQVGIPLVLHGGSGIGKEYIREAVRSGITKINIGTEIRQAYERALKSGNRDPQAEVASRVKWLIREFYEIEGSAREI